MKRILIILSAAGLLFFAYHQARSAFLAEQRRVYEEAAQPHDPNRVKGTITTDTYGTWLRKLAR
jgi:hypothetical protein